MKPVKTTASTVLFTQRSARRASRRRGAVLVETALVILLLIGLCFGVMEYGHYVYTRHTLESACQRGARQGILSDSTLDDVNNRIEGEMAAAGFDTTDFSVDVDGVDDDSVSDISVTVECVWGQIGIRPLGLIASDSVVRARVTMRKEGL